MSLSGARYWRGMGLDVCTIHLERVDWKQTGILVFGKEEATISLEQARWTDRSMRATISLTVAALVGCLLMGQMKSLNANRTGPPHGIAPSAAPAAFRAME